MKLLSVKPTPASSDKKYVAEFCKCKGPSKCKPEERLRVKFGQKGSQTYIEGASEAKKNAYIVRHGEANENWNTVSPGALARWILWSRKTLSAGIAEFKKHVRC